MNVIAISLNTNYDSAANINGVLDNIVYKYGGSSWHYTSPSGINPDLHHALLGRGLGGGRAYGGVPCNPGLGFRVSSGPIGDFVSMGNSVV